MLPNLYKWCIESIKSPSLKFEQIKMSFRECLYDQISVHQTIETIAQKSCLGGGERGDSNIFSTDHYRVVTHYEGIDQRKNGTN